MKKKTLFTLFVIIALVLVIAITFFVLVWNGIIILNGISSRAYPVRGVDVSHYQGEIDWAVLSDQDIHFAFIKATEGSSFEDDCFRYIFTEAQKSGLKVGAYHFFSFDSSGETQGANFVSKVKPFEGMLPPVVDFEFYGDHDKNPPDADTVTASLQTLLDILENYYKLTPIIYATESSYDLYLANGFEKYDIWIRNVITKPRMSDGRQWTFWQYTNRGRLDGYSGEERFIDINVFSGSLDDFNSYPTYNVN